MNDALTADSVVIALIFIVVLGIIELIGLGVVIIIEKLKRG